MGDGAPLQYETMPAAAATGGRVSWQPITWQSSPIGAADARRPGVNSAGGRHPAPATVHQGDLMDLGAFSISLAVKDISVSRSFYERLGFTVAGGDQDAGWLILRSGTTVLGLFQGMFEKNLLTFNPGWDQGANPLPEFTDVRAIQQRLKAAGIVPAHEADESTTGPAHFVVEDPDGNQILFDQHV
jgi:catechol 2,3-dioxygenase-like lactoylglutathione lyase family enzyme